MSRTPVPAEQRRFAKKLRSEQTALEARLWHELRARRLDGWKFRRQVPIGPYVADFVCHEARLVVEVDGPLHRRPEQRQKDAARDALIRSHGYSVMRFDDAIALGAMIDDIRLALPTAPLPTPD